MNSIDIQRKEKCYGCSACRQICPVGAISMQNDEEGFLYPKIDNKSCIECGKCKKICPYYKKERNTNTKFFYAAKAKENSIRENSASGGIFICLAQYVLEQKGVVYGAAFNSKFEVEHIKGTSSSDCKKMRGSKYVQSNLKDIFRLVKQDLEKNILVMFVGTSCQCAGLKSYLSKEYQNLLLCDLVCHGVPSPSVFKDYITYIQNKNKNGIVSYSFREKSEGWKEQKWGYILKNGKRKIDDQYIYIFKKLFWSECILRPSCYECQYASINKPSDITLGDFWGIENVCESIYDSLGVSLVLVHTPKGKQVFDNISSKLVIRSVKKEDCLQMNLKEPTKKPSNRENFWKSYKKGGIKGIARKARLEFLVGTLKQRIR